MRPAGWLVIPFVLLAPRLSEACTCIDCFGGYLTPNGEVPANIAAFFLLPSQPQWNVAEPLDVEMFDGSGRWIELRTRPLDRAVLLSPVEPLIIGERYRIRSAQRCGSFDGAENDVFEVTIGPERPLPTALGAIERSARMDGEVMLASDFSCFTFVKASYVDVSVDLHPSAAPWASAFHWTTEVDGRRWNPVTSYCEDRAPFASWVGAGVDRLYTNCLEGANGLGLSPEPHTIRMIATIPGQDLILETQPLIVDMSCEKGGTPPPTGDDPPPSNGLLLLEEPSCGCSATHERGDFHGALLMIALIARRFSASARRCRAARDGRR